MIEEASHLETLLFWSSATASTSFINFREISAKDFGLFSPLKFAEVETMGLFSLEINLLQNSSFTSLMPILPSSGRRWQYRH